MGTEEIDKILARQGVELLERMKWNEPGASEQLARWLKQSRRHTEHYLMAVAFDRELDETELDAALPREASSIPSNVVGLERSRCQSSIRPSRRRVGWLAASLAAGIAVAAAFFLQARRNEFSTTIGEQRTIALKDGSVVHLNTQSRIAVRFTGEARDIELLNGEALFKVRHDAARPFRVQTSDAIIQAIGTEFNVYRRQQGTTVEVLEGRVKVVSEKVPNSSRSVSLDRGEQARIDQAGKIATWELKDVTTAAAWRQRRLIFAGTPLPEIVAEFNRYNLTPQFDLTGDDAAEHTYSGVFDADDPQSLIELLQREPAMQLQNDGERVIIRVRSKAKTQ
jgi:transmembrane sensor